MYTSNGAPFLQHLHHNFLAVFCRKNNSCGSSSFWTETCVGFSKCFVACKRMLPLPLDEKHSKITVTTTQLTIQWQWLFLVWSQFCPPASRGSLNILLTSHYFGLIRSQHIFPERSRLVFVLTDEFQTSFLIPFWQKKSFTNIINLPIVKKKSHFLCLFHKIKEMNLSMLITDGIAIVHFSNCLFNSCCFVCWLYELLHHWYYSYQ